MKLIVKDRGAGKTCMLIQTSAITGYPIACINKSEVRFLKEKAEMLGVNIPEPISFDELHNGSANGKPEYDKILVDNIDAVLNKIIKDYFGVEEVVAATCSPYYTEEEWHKWEECAKRHERPNIYNVTLDL